MMVAQRPDVTAELRARVAAGNRYGKQAVDDVQSIFTKRAVKLGDATAFKELSFTDFLHSMALITVSFRSASLGLPI